MTRTAEGAGQDARQDDAPEARGEAAERRRHHQPGHGDAQGLAAVESVEEEGTDDARDGGGRGVAASDEADARGGDAERPGKEGPERQHHHEIEDVDELDRADEEDDGALARL